MVYIHNIEIDIATYIFRILDARQRRRSRMTNPVIVCSVCIAILSVAVALRITSYSYSSEMERKLNEIETFRANETEAVGELERNVMEILKTNQEYNKKQLERFQADAGSLEKEFSELKRLFHEMKEKLQENTQQNILEWNSSDKKLHGNEGDPLRRKIANIGITVGDFKRENENDNELQLFLFYSFIDNRFYIYKKRGLLLKIS